MQSVKHVPGPWKFSERNDGHYWVREANRDAAVEIARISPMGTIIETEANARLIAAAPELLEALKAARDWALAEAASATLQAPNRAAEKALAHFEAIIAKAEGRGV